MKYGSYLPFSIKPIHWPDEFYFVEESKRNLTLWLVYAGSMSPGNAELKINGVTVFTPAELDMSPQIIKTYRDPRDMIFISTLWWTNSLQWKITMLLMGKSTISMAMFNCFLLVHQRVHVYPWYPWSSVSLCFFEILLDLKQISAWSLARLECFAEAEESFYFFPGRSCKHPKFKEYLPWWSKRWLFQ